LAQKELRYYFQLRFVISIRPLVMAPKVSPLHLVETFS
jgi:hypothetical protein